MGSTTLSHNDWENIANIIFTAPNIEEVTIHMGSGVNTDTDKYLAKGSDASGYSLVADQDVTITSIKHGGDEKLKGDPIQVGINARRTRVMKHPSFTDFTISVLTAATTIQLEVY